VGEGGREGEREGPGSTATRTTLPQYSISHSHPPTLPARRLYQSAGKATQYSGPLDCALKTVRSEGLLAMQKGWLAQYARLGPHTILTFMALEALKPAVASVPLLQAPRPPTSGS
jgi:hypothetical protein